MVLVLLCGCQHSNNISFNADESLSQYLDKEKVYDIIKANPIGSDNPEIVYASDKYAVIFNYNGTLIYDFESNKICGAIDNTAINMTATQGDNVTNFYCNDEYVFMCKNSEQTDSGNAKGYLYSIKENKMCYIEKMELSYFNSDNGSIQRCLEDNPLDAVQVKYNKEGNRGFSVYPRNDDIVVFEYGYNPNSEFKLYTLSEDLELISEYEFE